MLSIKESLSFVLLCCFMSFSYNVLLKKKTKKKLKKNNNNNNIIMEDLKVTLTGYKETIKVNAGS